MDEELILIKRLEMLRDRHRELDERIKSLEEPVNQDQLLVVRMKKQKLSLRDEILRLEQILYPDIIA